MSQITVEIADRSDTELWNRIIDRSPHGSIFHTWEWLEVAEKYSMMKLYPLIGYRGTTPIAAFPFFVKKIGLFNFVFSPPPRLIMPFLGPVIIDYDNLKQNKKETIYHSFVRDSVNLINSLRPMYATIITPPNLIDARQFLWCGFKAKPIYNYFFDISMGKEYLWKRLKKARRKNITKTAKEFEFRVGNRKDFDFVINGVFTRIQEQNIKPKLNREYLNAIRRQFSRNLQVHLVLRNGENVAGLINLTHNDTVYSWLGNFKKSIKGYAPNDLLLWRTIEYYVERGYTRFFEIGANTQRLLRFKSGFNPDLVLNFIFTKANPLVENCVWLIKRLEKWKS